MATRLVFIVAVCGLAYGIAAPIITSAASLLLNVSHVLDAAMVQ
jgi:hypothetical protein